MNDTNTIEILDAKEKPAFDPRIYTRLTGATEVGTSGKVRLSQ